MHAAAAIVSNFEFLTQAMKSLLTPGGALLCTDSLSEALHDSAKKNEASIINEIFRKASILIRLFKF